MKTKFDDLLNSLSDKEKSLVFCLLVKGVRDTIPITANAVSLKVKINQLMDSVSENEIKEFLS